MKIVKEDWLKRIEFEEEEDRISLLPDCLLVEILLRLHSTKKAITTSILSKRWKYVWTLVPTLDFKYYHKLDDDWLSDFFPLVEKTLNQCSSRLKLNKFQLNSLYYVQFESQLNNCIRYAINRDVEDLDLSFYPNGLVLDEFFFMSSCFTHLKLENCIYNPIGAISWKNLKSLHISEGKLNEDLIANILSGSPVLETLNLEFCIGFWRVDITSKSVKNIGLLGYSDYRDAIDVIEINAPNILSLTIEDNLCLKSLILLDVSSLVKAKLDYIHFYKRKEDEKMLKRLILNLRHVKELTIGTQSSPVLFRLEDEGFISPFKMKVFYHEFVNGLFRVLLRDDHDHPEGCED